MLASSDVYIVAHKLTRDEGTKKKKNVSLTPFLLSTTSAPINLI